MIQVEAIVYLKNIEVEAIVQLRKTGVEAETLVPALKGKSQYQSYLETTTDNPPLSEMEWSDSRLQPIDGGTFN
jgi:hypothetical protein